MANSALENAIEGLETAVDAVEEAAKNLPAMSESAVSAVSDAAHGVSGGAIDPFVFQLAIFVLAIFIGYFVVWSVTPALHTPLMAVTNAISSVIVVGALLSVAVSATGGLATTFGFIGLVLAAVNIFGGFLVTQRMLAMYKKKER
jgi:NAD(P) transhydrogenase subunit alpha